MLTKIRLVSATMLKEFHSKEIDGVDFSSSENSGEIEVVAEITNADSSVKHGKSVLVSKVISDFDIFKKDIEAFKLWKPRKP